jgi:hypothetical protein
MTRAGDRLPATRERDALCAVLVLASLFALAPGAASGGESSGAGPELLYVSEGNRLRVVDIDSIGRRELLAKVLIENEQGDPVRGRDINGMICRLPDSSGRFVAGEDTGQPATRPGWGVLTPEGAQVGKLAPSAAAKLADPYGCAFDAQGRLFTSELGDPGLGAGNGQLILWFPPFDHFPGPPGAYPDTDSTSKSYCKIATDLGTATGLAIDGAGRVYVAAAGDMKIWRFSPPFPSGPSAADGCGGRGPDGAPLADAVQREPFAGMQLLHGLYTYTGLAMAPGGESLYAASVVTGRIGEFDLQGRLRRLILVPAEWFPPFSHGTPQGLSVDSGGNLYYTDLDLRRSGLGVDTGPDGKVWRIAFDAVGNPLAPELILEGLAFPDGLGVLPGDLENK